MENKELQHANDTNKAVDMDGRRPEGRGGEWGGGRKTRSEGNHEIHMQTHFYLLCLCSVSERACFTTSSSMGGAHIREGYEGRGSVYEVLS